MRSILKENKGRKIAVLSFGAAMYALLFSVGSQIDAFGTAGLGATLGRFAVSFPAAWLILLALMEFLMPKMVCMPKQAGRPFHTFAAFIGIGLCYVPMLLIEYPGSFVYDTSAQIWQVASGQYNAAHPLAHTLLLGFCLSFYDVFQSIERCAFLYSVLQSALIAGCFALICASISRTCSRRAARLSVVYFGLFPYHMLFAGNYTKDVLFGAFFALLVAYLMEETQTGLTLGRRIVLILSGTLACLFRNNMIYSLAVWIVLAMIWGKGMRRTVCFALAAALLGAGAGAGLAALTNAEGGDAKEMFSVPAQQLARAYQESPESFTPEERAAMDEFFKQECYTRYDEKFADPVKNFINTPAVMANPRGALKLWASIGKKCPDIYHDAFWNLALPFLYPYRSYHGTVQYIELGLNPRVLGDPFGQTPPTQPQRFEAARAWLDGHVASNGASGIPVLRWLLNAGLLIWVMLLCAGYALYSGRGKRFTLIGLVLLLWLTYLLGPVMQGRYLYPFVCVLPLLLAIPKTEEVEKIDI